MALVQGLGAATFSSQYHEFVHTTIHPRFHHDGHFHASVGRDIPRGESWRLGLFLTHEVHAGRVLNLVADDVASGDRVVLATGEVDYRLGISSVAHIAEKFQSAQTDLGSWLDAGSRVVAVVPEGNRYNVPDKFRTHRRNGNRLKTVASASVDDLLSQLGLLTGPVAATDTGRKADVSAGAHAAPESGSSKRRWWVGAAILALVVILAGEENTPDMVRDVVQAGTGYRQKDDGRSREIRGRIRSYDYSSARSVA